MYYVTQTKEKKVIILFTSSHKNKFLPSQVHKLMVVERKHLLPLNSSINPYLVFDKHFRDKHKFHISLYEQLHY